MTGEAAALAAGVDAATVSIYAADPGFSHKERHAEKSHEPAARGATASAATAAARRSTR